MPLTQRPTPHGSPETLTRMPRLQELATAMRLELLAILQTKNPEMYSLCASLSDRAQVEELCRQPEVRQLLTDMMLYELGFYVGAEVIHHGTDHTYIVSAVRVVHGSNGAPEFIQLFGDMGGDANGTAPGGYIGHIYEFTSLQTGYHLVDPGLLGIE